VIRQACRDGTALSGVSVIVTQDAPEALPTMHFTGPAPALMRRLAARQDGDQELPGLEDEVHGGPDAAAATSIASGLEDGLSSA
jgi:hypothetical protein